MQYLRLVWDLKTMWGVSLMPMAENSLVRKGLAARCESSRAAVLFRLDGTNRVWDCEGEWDDVAPNVDGQALFSEMEEGQKFTHFIKDPSIRSIFKTLVDRARKNGDASFDYRSDTPELRRWFTMTIASPDGVGVTFSAGLSKTQARNSKSSPVVGEKREELFLRLCSWCQRVAVPPDSWLPVEAAMEILKTMSGDELPQVTHSICPSCQKDLLEETRALRRVSTKSSS